MIERLLIFGCIYTYEQEGKTVKVVCYLDSSSGMAFKEKADAILADRVDTLSLKPGDLVTGLFTVDAFNKCTLKDVKLS